MNRARRRVLHAADRSLRTVSSVDQHGGGDLLILEPDLVGRRAEAHSMSAVFDTRLEIIRRLGPEAACVERISREFLEPPALLPLRIGHIARERVIDLVAQRCGRQPTRELAVAFKVKREDIVVYASRGLRQRHEEIDQRAGLGGLASIAQAALDLEGVVDVVGDLAEDRVAGLALADEDALRPRLRAVEQRVGAARRRQTGRIAPKPVEVVVFQEKLDARQTEKLLVSVLR